MFSVSSSSSIGESTKEYTTECVNSEQMEHYKRFLLCGISNGFFTELQNTIACTGCSKQSFFVRKIDKKKGKVLNLGSSDSDDHCIDYGNTFCAKCYVERFCNIHRFQNHDGSETHYIFKEKGNGGGIVYQSSPIIERTSSSESGKH